MKVKNAELFGLIDDLNHLVAERIKLSVKGDVYLLINKLNPLFEVFNKVKNDFIKQHGTGDDKKGFAITPEKYQELKAELKKEFEDLHDKEHDVETRLKLDVLSDVESSHPYQFLIKFLNGIKKK